MGRASSPCMARAPCQSSYRLARRQTKQTPCYVDSVGVASAGSSKKKALSAQHAARRCSSRTGRCGQMSCGQIRSLMGALIDESASQPRPMCVVVGCMATGLDAFQHVDPRVASGRDGRNLQPGAVRTWRYLRDAALLASCMSSPTEASTNYRANFAPPTSRHSNCAMSRPTSDASARPHVCIPPSLWAVTHVFVYACIHVVMERFTHECVYSSMYSCI